MREATIKGRGGARPISPVRRCPYCGRELALYCQSKRTYRWGPLQVELIRLICRRESCREEARRDGWYD